MGEGRPDVGRHDRRLPPRHEAASGTSTGPASTTLADKLPNPAHEALAELERRGLLEAVITQNIDRLHRKAGSERVIEVHGSIATASCTSCAASYPLEQVESLFDADGVATCAGCAGKVKPDVVLFGELLPRRCDGRGGASCARGADLLLCIGSSLEVYPVAGLPELTLEQRRADRDRHPGARPRTTPRPSVRLDGDVAEDLSSVLAALG